MTELSYRDYRRSPLIGVDIETKDPLLTTKGYGTGVYRKDGYVIGVSLSDGETSEYYPLRHTDTTPSERETNSRYLKAQLAHNNNKVFANAQYDLDWLVNGLGWEVGGHYDDVQIAEPLLDEYRRSFSLDSLSTDYLGEGKLYRLPEQYALQAGWVKQGREKDAVSHLWRMPFAVVEEYAKADALKTVNVFKKQTLELERQGLLDLYGIETGLIPLLLQMRKAGVNIDLPYLERLGGKLERHLGELKKELKNAAGFEVNVNSALDLTQLFKSLGIPLTHNAPTPNMIEKALKKGVKPVGNPVFDKRSLSKIDNAEIRKVLEIRHIQTLLSFFVEPYSRIAVDGVLRCSFNILKNDDYGTVSGRLSASNPNLQQVSGKEEESFITMKGLTGKVIRRAFVPHEDCDWLKLDFSQIEYRVIAHYARGEGADVIRARYNENPKTDYHTELGLMTGISHRPTVKTLNFGAAYGMGWRTMAKNYGWSEERAREVYEQYHRKVPFVKKTSYEVVSKAKSRGYVRTILGRRCRLPHNEDKAFVLFNHLIQGSAADIMKKSMLESYRAGLFDVLIPHLTVHDEMDVSKPRTKAGDEAGKNLKYIMENCVKLKVPVIAEAEAGTTWGDLAKWQKNV